MRRLRTAVAAFAAAATITACTGTDDGGGSDREPFALPVGTTEWDAFGPAWLFEGTIHVGDQSVEVPRQVHQFVVAPTGVYWLHLRTLYFTDVDGVTEEVDIAPGGRIAVSADRSVFATTDQSRGPTDRAGQHVIQVAAYDARTGAEIYRTPDEEPDADVYLGDLYDEGPPSVQGVSDEVLFFDGATISLEDGSAVPAGEDPIGLEQYAEYAQTLFPDGFHVGVRTEGGRRLVDEPSALVAGRLSPDRSTLFDVRYWPTPAVAYDAGTGRRIPIEAPWRHFTLGGFLDEDTFWGAAELIQVQRRRSVARAHQVVTCELPALVCEAASPVYRSDKGVTTGLRLESTDIVGADQGP